MATDGLIVAATVGNGLTAGLLLGFSCAVLPGLGRADDATFVTTFRVVNRAIQNPVFGLVFAGTPLVAAASVVAVGVGDRSVMPWVVAGLAGSAVTIAITFARNIPLNDALDEAPTATAAGLRAARTAFEGPWSRWNAVRTLASTVATACLARALAG
ncbi:MAG: anthrone oxygenase family protein [Actinomycetaceae bacterium]